MWKFYRQEEADMKVAVVGSRKAQDFDFEKIGGHLPEDCCLLISGGAVGVDSAAEQYANAHGIAFRKILPDYQEHGRIAPLIRDTKIVKEADMVLAFWDYQSKGTSFTISECIRLGVPVRIIGLKD
jgi:hypothetical protein